MDEKEKKNYLAMWNGSRGADRNPVNYQRRDDGNHIYKSDQYFEWWYTDCSFDNGYHAVATFHYMNGFMKPIVPTSQVMIYKPDGTKVVRFASFTPEEIYAGADYCDVRMGDGWIRDTGQGYEIFIKIKGVGLHLNFKNVVPGWKPGTGFLYKNEEKGLVSGWCVPVPYGEVSGELFLKEETLKVRGAGYHDHNWGNCAMHGFVEGWYWGRIHNRDYTVDYGWVIPRDKEAPVMSPLLLAKGGEIVLSTDMMTTDFADIVRDKTNGKDYAKTLIIGTEAKGVKLQLNVKTTREIESMELPKVTDWKQYYYRFLADYDMKIEIDGQKDRVQGEMLHELMLL